MSQRKEALLTFPELIPLWIVHVIALAMLFGKGYLAAPQCAAIVMATLVSFLSGARVERYRAWLEKLEGSDGTG